MKLVHRICLVLALLAPCSAGADPVDPPPAPQSGQRENGFALELRLNSRFAALNTGGGSPASIGLLQGGFSIGGKYGRVIVGLGFDILRLSQDSGSQTRAQTAILFTPGVRFVLAASADRRVELYGLVELGFGTTLAEPDQGSQSNYRIVYTVGPGLRYWVAPQFAFGAMAGVSGDFSIFSSGPFVGSTTIGLTSIVGGLQFLGIF